MPTLVRDKAVVRRQISFFIALHCNLGLLVKSKHVEQKSSASNYSITDGFKSRVLRIELETNWSRKGWGWWQWCGMMRSGCLQTSPGSTLTMMTGVLGFTAKFVPLTDTVQLFKRVLVPYWISAIPIIEFFFNHSPGTPSSPTWASQFPWPFFSY